MKLKDYLKEKLNITDKEAKVDNNYDLDKIHCNGCPNNCALSNTRCGRGKMLKEEISKRQR